MKFNVFNLNPGKWFGGEGNDPLDLLTDYAGVFGESSSRGSGYSSLGHGVSHSAIKNFDSSSRGHSRADDSDFGSSFSRGHVDKSGSQNDGPGNNRVGLGDQTITHVVGSNDTFVAYDAGKGDDILELRFTSDLYNSEAVRNELLDYQEFLANSVDHDSSGLHGKVFTFSTLNISVQNVESLTVTVDGASVVVEPYVEALPSFFTEEADTFDFATLIDWEEVAEENPNDGMHDALAGDDVVHLPDTYAIAASVGYDPSIMFDGGAGNDQIFGGDHVNSFITGGDGDDYVYGGLYGNNKLYGGDGDDILVGGREHDTLYGEAGNDHLMGGQKWASDTLYGGAGDDELEGGGGDDFLYGGADNDVLRGSEGNDILEGGAGSDKLYGDLGNDILDGGAGNDLLYGFNGNDVLNGGEGNDRVWGQGGNDTLIFTMGESDGADRYVGGQFDYDIFRVEVNDVLQLDDILSDLHLLQDSIDSSTEFGVYDPNASWGNQDNVYLGSMGVYVDQVEEIQVSLNGSMVDWAGF